MCGRVRLSSDVSEIKLVFRIPPDRPRPNFPPSWNVAPTDTLPVMKFFSADPLHRRRPADIRGYVCAGSPDRAPAPQADLRRHDLNRDSAEPRPQPRQRMAQHADAPQLILQRGDAPAPDTRHRAHAFPAMADRAGDCCCHGRTTEHPAPAGLSPRPLDEKEQACHASHFHGRVWPAQRSSRQAGRQNYGPNQC